MTKDQAHIVLLEPELRQAQSTVEFLHGCLTDPIFAYDYPDQIEHHLRLWSRLAPQPPYCVHSVHKPDCASCTDHIARMTQRSRALETLGLNREYEKQDV